MDYRIYPPIMEAKMPAFIATEGVNISFKLSLYNSISSIGGIQVTVREVAGNTAVWDRTKYPTGLFEIPFASLVTSLDENTGETLYNFKIPYGEKETDLSTVCTGAIPFKSGVYYKVQLRFYNNSYTIQSNTKGPTDSYIQKNLDCFSEWSTVSLIKPIAVPTVYIKQFDGISDYTQAYTSIISIDSPQELTLNGSINFATIGGDETNTSRLRDLNPEYLASYRFTLDPEVVEIDTPHIIQSDWIVTNNEIGNNQFEYSLRYDFQIGRIYNLKFEYKTNNGYEGYKNYTFNITEPYLSPLIAVDELDPLQVTPNEELGGIEVSFTPAESETYHGNIAIRRAGSDSEYLEWTDIYIGVVNFAEDKSAKTIIDNTVESNIFYRYVIEKVTVLGKRGMPIPKILKKIGEEPSPYDGSFGTFPQLVILNHIFLTREDKQLRVQLNPSVNSFSYKVNEGFTEAIGSKYPYYKRNGKIFYRTFDLSGTISFEMDKFYHFFEKDTKDRIDSLDPNVEYTPDSDDLIHYEYDWIHEFIESKKEYFRVKNPYATIDSDAIYNDYEKYNEDNKINEEQDFIWEKFFRDEVIKWLYENNLKLYRSPSEGNVIVKLSNISLAPNQELNRMIWDFSCTCTEMADKTWDNYVKYGLISTPEVQNYTDIDEPTLIQQTFNLKGLNTIADERSMSNDVIIQLNQMFAGRGVDNLHKKTLNSITSFRIEMPADAMPYPVAVENGVLRRVAAVPVIEEENGAIHFDSNYNIKMGYIIHINSEPYYISPLGILDWSDIGYLDISSISILQENIPNNKKNEKISPFYITSSFYCNTVTVEDSSVIPTRKIYFDKLCQINNNFKIQNEDFGEEGDDIIRLIKERYVYMNKDRTYKQNFNYIKFIEIEAPVGAAFIVNDTDRYYVGRTGKVRLNAYVDEDQELHLEINKLCFIGYQLYEMENLNVGEVPPPGYFKVSDKSGFNLLSKPSIDEVEENTRYKQPSEEGEFIEYLHNYTENNGRIVEKNFGGHRITNNTDFTTSGDYSGLNIEVGNIDRYIIWYQGGFKPITEDGLVLTDVNAYVTFRAVFSGEEYSNS